MIEVPMYAWDAVESFLDRGCHEYSSFDTINGVMLSCQSSLTDVIMEIIASNQY